jgi:hypothetical protein
MACRRGGVEIAAKVAPGREALGRRLGRAGVSTGVLGGSQGQIIEVGRA